MNILLVNPWSLKKFNVIIIPNVSLGYLASSLQRVGHDVKMLDCVKDKVDIHGFKAYLAANEFDMVGFSLFTPYIGAVSQYAEAVKAHNVQTVTLAGGPHPTLEPYESMDMLPHVDFAFRGEAERGICQLTEFLSKNPDSEFLHSPALNKIENLVWRNSSHEVICNPRTYIEDLDSLPFPAWELMDPNSYPLAPIGVFSRKTKVAPIIATRGCPYPCTFCAANKMSGKKIRYRSAHNILKEIIYLKTHFDIEEINIIDDNFTMKKGLVEDFCHMLIQNQLGISWSCPNGIRLDTLDKNLLQLMERSGCYSFGVGIEFGTQKMLDHVKKQLTLETIRTQIDLIKSVTHIRITGFFIIGHPKESVDDINATIDFACSLKLDRANFFNYSPFPGSVDYENLKNEGYHYNQWYDSLYINNVIYTPKNVTRDQLIRLQKKAFERFFLRPRILWNIIKETRSFTQLKVLIIKILRLLFDPEKL